MLRGLRYAAPIMSGRTAFQPEPFQPERHERELRAILHEIESLCEELPGAGGSSAATDPIESNRLDRILRKYPRDGKGFFSRSQLLAGFRHFAGPGAEAEVARFARRIQLRPVRTRSGVTPLTVLTKPFPCPGRCVFCPNDVRMPKSYLSDEPGAQRAARNGFDPYRQTWSRLCAFRDIGHPTDKVELIVLGGTWSFYPAPYQRWFVTRCLDAMHDFARGIDARQDATWDQGPDYQILPPTIDGREVGGGLGPTYNQRVRGLLAETPEVARPESMSWVDVEAAQRENEASTVRCVGLVLETRPDRIDEQEVRRLRRLGCTKVQLGVQSLDDEVLARNRRGHGVFATRRAFRLLRASGFKIHAHWMPNLLGANAVSDREDFTRLFDDADFRPDELKIYPCSLVESAELMRDYERGDWRPYSHDELLSLLVDVLARVPRSCRVTRMIRDISSDDIVAGNKLTNFRETVERALVARGGRSQDIRAREIRDQAFDPQALSLRATHYEASGGSEHFLELVTPEDRLVGFARLRLPREHSFIEELEASALLREVHVYGVSLQLGRRSAGDAQHRGVGRRLVEEAARRATAAGFSDLAVISAIGTREYYRRLGFDDGRLYQHRKLGAPVGLRAR
jgi:elongator complex protein 3